MHLVKPVKLDTPLSTSSGRPALNPLHKEDRRRKQKEGRAEAAPLKTPPGGRPGRVFPPEPGRRGSLEVVEAGFYKSVGQFARRERAQQSRSAPSRGTPVAAANVSEIDLRARPLM